MRVGHVLDPNPDQQQDAHHETLAALVQAIDLGAKLYVYAGPLHRRQRKRMEEIAERHWAAITVRRALPGPRSNPSLPWTTTHFGGLPPGATGCCSFFTFATTPGKDLITAGVVGTGAGTVVGRLPALAVVLAVLAAGTCGGSAGAAARAPAPAPRRPQVRSGAAAGHPPLR